MKYFIGIMCAIIIVVIFVAVDQGVGADLPRTGIATGRSYSEATTIYTTQSNGNGGFITVPQFIPETYYLLVETKEGVAKISVQPYDYQNTIVGDTVNFVDKVGYFSGHRYKN